MANPQIENGYTKIANEILEALARIRIAGEARQMLDVIIRKTYGYNKKIDRISTSQFMEATGLTRRVIYKMRKKLKYMNLITVSQKGDSQVVSYLFQKDYKKWKVSPKKETVSQKGDRCLPKRSQTVSQLGTHKRKKDNIQNKPSPSAQGYLMELLNHYKELQGVPLLTNYPRLMKRAKELVKLAGSAETAKECMTWVADTLNAKGLIWKLETIIDWYPRWLKHEEESEVKYE